VLAHTARQERKGRESTVSPGQHQPKPNSAHSASTLALTVASIFYDFGGRGYLQIRAYTLIYDSFPSGSGCNRLCAEQARKAT
jgi:hypothetical protein